MNDTKKATNENAHETALGCFIGSITEVRERLAELTDYFDNHMNCSPDDVGWGDVTTADYFRKKLTELTDMAFDRGEHALKDDNTAM